MLHSKPIWSRIITRRHECPFFCLTLVATWATDISSYQNNPNGLPVKCLLMIVAHSNHIKKSIFHGIPTSWAAAVTTFFVFDRGTSFLVFIKTRSNSPALFTGPFEKGSRWAEKDAGEEILHPCSFTTASTVNLKIKSSSCFKYSQRYRWSKFAEKFHFPVSLLFDTSRCVFQNQGWLLLCFSFHLIAIKRRERKVVVWLWRHFWSSCRSVKLTVENISASGSQCCVSIDCSCKSEQMARIGKLFLFLCVLMSSTSESRNDYKLSHFSKVWCESWLVVINGSTPVGA